MSDWKRQHSAAIFIGFLSSIKEMLFTMLAVLIFGQSSQFGGGWFYTIFFALILVFSLANGIIKWATFKYKLQENELQIKHGLIFRKSRYIRKERIQSIDINAKLLQRLFGLVELRIETAGGGAEPEFRLIALRREEANLIKTELLKRQAIDIEGSIDESAEDLKDIPASDEKFTDFTWELSKQRLVIAAITSSGIGIAATFVAAITSQVQQFIPEAMYERVIGWVIHSSVLLIGFWIVFILLIGWIISLISTLLKYGMFKIDKRDDEIHISRGVIEQRQLTLSAKRITAVRLVQNIIRQPFGFVSVYVESAGGGRKDEDLSTILIPICKKGEVNQLLKEVLPDFVVEKAYEPLPAKSVRRYIIRLIIPSVFVATLLVYFFNWGWITIIIPLLAGAYGYWQYSSAGIGIDGNNLLLKSRAISLTEVILPRKRIQAMKSTQSLFQRLDDLCTIHVSIITSIVGKTFSLRHISKDQRDHQFSWYSYEEEKENIKGESKG
ncbi:putative membrane protein [Evansella vedderi]|uniref:Membrane protein n=1 Tax=Evansella vedderi TaxID=38282 RepID=A0ABT9ZVH7_9BACI|nr:PH domain-containing protein [Evansella vedderi]MDQ0255238.1 putative membrane protein [Evansella vedderi]